MIFCLLGNEVHQKENTRNGSHFVWFGASGVGFRAVVWGSEDNFANNGVRRSEMWGSWTPSPPSLVFQIQIQILIISGLFGHPDPDLIHLRLDPQIQIR